MPDRSIRPPDLARSPHVVFKFGGTTVGTAERFRTVIALLREAASEGPVVAVVSALSRVSRRLSAAVEAVATQSDRSTVVEELTETLRARHMAQAEAVLSSAQQEAYEALLNERLRALRRHFAQVERAGFTPAGRDAVLAVGEQLSVPMVTLALRDAGLEAPHCDATNLVITDDTFGEANVNHEATAERIREWYQALAPGAVPVVAGFIGAAETGSTTTLGFEGSDYSAALFARLLGAQCLTRYTDVDGLYTDDPAANENAERLDRLSMEEAHAMTESGRLGMHPKTLRPLADANIPLQVRSIVEP
ncbi:MAG: aspartate kinase, partial [Salinibacter sp.]|uniref:aspartate kinase n=1 Tax=Salinibacter sp. TaxID=2065818 RepID=UPI0035D506CC